ncbi:MAG: SAM-dependent DNA methyltransferase [Nitrospirae bacterium]|nr:SAM-dependent DNA methyltransferase [Nitrospirota bacterium]
MAKEPENKSMESWIWDAACSIHGAVDAPKYKDFILPLIFVKRLCDVFDDEINRIASEVGSREKAFRLVEHDKKLVRFYIPLKSNNAEEPVWTAIRKLTAKIGETLTTHLRAVAKENPLLSGIIDRVDFNATTHGVRDIDDDRLSNLIEKVSTKRLGLNDVEPDIIGRSYEYLIRKFAEGGGQSAGEFYTPKEVGMIMAKIMNPEHGMTIYDPCCGSAGLLIKCELALNEKMQGQGRKKFSGLTLYGQEYIAQTWAMANMNMIIHDMEGQIEIGDTFRNPKFRDNNRLMTFDRVVANPMWNQTMFGERDYNADTFGRFPNGAGYPGNKADWGWMQHIFASLNDRGKAAVVFDTGAASRGSGNSNSNKEKEVRKWFVENDIMEGVLYLPENLFYNTSAPGIILFLNKLKPADRKNKLFLVNASKEFAKGDPKNYITEEGIGKIASAFLKWEEIEKFSRIVTKEEIVRNDYNISPSRYIHVSEAEEYRPITEIVEELNALDEEAKETNAALRAILSRIGI